MKPKETFYWRCELMVICPHCFDGFDFTETDDWHEQFLNTNVCHEIDDIKATCPACHKDFVFDVGDGQ